MLTNDFQASFMDAVGLSLSRAACISSPSDEDHIIHFLGRSLSPQVLQYFPFSPFIPSSYIEWPSDTPLILHNQAILYPIFRDQISQRMYILSSVHTSILSQVPTPLKLLHPSKANERLLPNAILFLTQYILGFEGDLGPWKYSSLLTRHHRHGIWFEWYDNSYLPSSSLGPHSAFSFIKNSFLKNSQYTLIMVSSSLLLPILPTSCPMQVHTVCLSSVNKQASKE